MTNGVLHLRLHYVLAYIAKEREIERGKKAVAEIDEESFALQNQNNNGGYTRGPCVFYL